MLGGFAVESMMRARFVTIAVAALALAGIAHAQPAKVPLKPDSTSKANDPVVLASADHAPNVPPVGEAAPTPPKHRAVRVTTCRCGGEPQLESQEERR